MKRRPRFRRATPPALAVTDRDIEIMRHVARHRFLRSTQIIDLVAARSKQKILRRLHVLYHNGFLDRPPAQLEYYRAGGGSKPMVYGLGNKGADLLATQFALPRSRVDWTTKNRTTGQLFVEHTLGVADVMLAFERASKTRSSTDIMYLDTILKRAPEATRRSRKPYGWRIRVPFNGTSQRVGVIPDKIFGIRFSDKPAGENSMYFFLEVDRGTMPATRTNLYQTSFLRKLLGYGETHRGQIHMKLYGIQSFRVLTVTTSFERIENLIDAYQGLVRELCPPSVFLFTDHTSILANDILSVPWINGAREIVRLEV